jgi:steroid delta-isomerase-like uncharacterized protein
MAYDNAALARRFVDEVWTKGNIGVADELVAPSYVRHDPIAGDLEGIEALKAHVREYRGAFPDLRFVIDDLVVAGDKVVTRWTVSGTHKGPLMGIAPTGKTFAVPGITVARLVNGKLVEQWPIWDTLKFMQNLGLVPQLGMGEARTEVREARPH